VLAVLIALPAPPTDSTAHVRSASPLVRALIDEAVVSSPTVSDLLARIEESDTIVYVEFTGSPDVPRARTKLAASTPDVRFLRISINLLVPPWDRVPLLAHELQHAAEIAGATDARDEDGLRRLYDRIGVRAKRDQYETAAARDAEYRTRRDQAEYRSKR
jgi:hypothetical protein